MKTEEFHELINKNKENYKGFFETWDTDFCGHCIILKEYTIHEGKKSKVFLFDGDLYADFAFGDSYGEYYSGNYKPWKVEKVVKQVVVDQVSYNRI